MSTVDFMEFPCCIPYCDRCHPFFLEKSHRHTTRTFHPIGHGAFYTEVYKSKNGVVNVVYDCGTQHRINKDNKAIVKAAFDKDSTIDILFISHYHSDHVKLIGELKSNFMIKMVIMPYLSDIEKIFIYSCLNGYKSEILSSILLSPQLYFGEETKLITVTPSEPNIVSNMFQEIPPNSLDELRTGDSLISGASYTLSALKEWEYIPFYPSIPQDDLNTFKSEVENAFGDTCANLIKNVALIKDKKTISIMRELYESIKSNINLTSLLLFSGPINKDARYSCSIVSMGAYKCIIEKLGCIYTGDSTLSQELFDKAFGNNVSSRISIQQVPHHGSAKNSKGYQHVPGVIYFASVPNMKNQTHPADTLIVDIQRQGGILHLVTQKTQTKLVQMMCYWSY